MTDVSRYFDQEMKNRKKIQISGPRSYVDSVEKILKDCIYSSYVGRAVLSEIYGSAQGTEVHIKFSSSSGADSSGVLEDSRAEGSYATDLTKGTGKGASSVLSFDLTCKLPSNLCKTKCTNPRFNLPRFVLLHELVHSMRHVRGKWRAGVTVNLNRKSLALEEAIGIVITNIFMSEKGDNKLRADHVSLDTIGPDVQSFVKQPTASTILDQIRADHPALYNGIAGLKQSKFPFNPFAAHP